MPLTSPDESLRACLEAHCHCAVRALKREELPNGWYAVSCVGRGADDVPFFISGVFDRNEKGFFPVSITETPCTDYALLRNTLRAASAQMSGAPVEYDVVTGMLRDPREPNLRCALGEALRRYVHSDDGAGVRAALNDGRKHVLRCRCRAREEDAYEWRRFFVTPVKDETGFPRAAFLRVTADEASADATETRFDLLTGLRTRAGTIESLQEYLSGEGHAGRHCLLLLDMDNFGALNEEKGREACDTLLTEISRALSGLFRAGDLTGRVGGDEFCILIKDLFSRGLIAKKADEVLRRMREMGGDVTCSIGIALFPQDARDGASLLRAAEESARVAKKRGKNTFWFTH